MSELSILTKKMAELNEEAVMKIAQRALDIKMPPLEIIQSIIDGLEQVGSMYESQEYSIADLIMGGIIFENVLDMEDMQNNLEFDCDGQSPVMSGIILLGTIRGDIHDIGKNIFHSLAVSIGFRVIDLGVDVSAEAFCEAAKKYKPDIIALSSVLGKSTDNIRNIVEKLKGNAETKESHIILGGVGVSPDRITSLDIYGYSKSAKEGVELCMRIKRQINDSLQEGDING